MNTRTRIGGILVALLAVVGTSAISIAAASGASISSHSWLPGYLKGPAPSTVTIDVTVNPNQAIDELDLVGYFKQVDQRFHTNIVGEPFSSGPGALAQLVGGSVQFLASGISTSAAADLSGSDLIQTFSGGVSFTSILTANISQKASRGTDVKNFGPPATWCQLAPGGFSAAAVQLLAAENGFNINQLNLTTVGVLGAPAALQSGRCTLSTGETNSAFEAVLSGTEYIVRNILGPIGTLPLVGEEEGVPLITTDSFVHQYPKLNQAIVDAQLEAMEFLFQHLKDPSQVWKQLPAAMKATLPLGLFTQEFTSLEGLFSPKYMSGYVTNTMMADTMAIAEAEGTVPVGTLQSFNPSTVFTNRFVAQGYKDLHLTPPPKALLGPNPIPKKLIKPSLQAATAYGILLHTAAPANSGQEPIKVPASS